MSMPKTEKTIITSHNVRAYFYDAVVSAAQNQRLDARDATFNYIVNLLTTYSRSEELYENTNEGVRLKPLALIYGDAVSTENETNRQKALRKLGDVALFIAGMFSASLQRKLVDIDYYIAMGGNAYAYLADHNHFGLLDEKVFDELAQKFTRFVDLLMEINEHSDKRNAVNILRWYEVWLKTGSRYAARQLTRQGIEPSLNNTSKQLH